MCLAGDAQRPGSDEGLKHTGPQSATEGKKPQMDTDRH